MLTGRDEGGRERMHISEGFLPIGHALAWSAVSAPFVVHGGRRLARQVEEQPEARLLLGAAGAVTFLFSALKLPSVAGSSSHPTGTALGTVLLGPSGMSVLVGIVLLFQALLLAHGGLTTLGANLFAMGIAGPWLAAGAFEVQRRLGLSTGIAAGGAAIVANLGTYLVTAIQLALAFPKPATGIQGSFVTFVGIFAWTQVPLAILEGIVTTIIVRHLLARWGSVGERPLLLSQAASK